MISNAKTVIIDSSNFSRNSGFLQTGGIAVMIARTESVLVLGCQFSENLGGEKGSAIYI